MQQEVFSFLVSTVVMFLSLWPLVWTLVWNYRCWKRREAEKVAAEKKVTAPPTLDWCHGCNEIRPASQMAFDPSGDYRCAQCRGINEEISESEQVSPQKKYWEEKKQREAVQSAHSALYAELIAALRAPSQGQKTRTIPDFSFYNPPGVYVRARSALHNELIVMGRIPGPSMGRPPSGDRPYSAGEQEIRIPMANGGVFRCPMRPEGL